ncbi:hypothetical protein H920_10922 [Fukomys damarensis]|uniref:Uncharacterized protein n=1 Tax=Fukomys damarensis TaxID=885580 RepID=A0A091DBN4_FUKDA|nr:hypothetical protein H920_10922 [Fukomys damarensis]
MEFLLGNPFSTPVGQCLDSPVILVVDPCLTPGPRHMRAGPPPGASATSPVDLEILWGLCAISRLLMPALREGVPEAPLGLGDAPGRPIHQSFLSLLEVEPTAGLFTPGLLGDIIACILIQPTSLLPLTSRPSSSRPFVGCHYLL